MLSFSSCSFRRQIDSHYRYSGGLNLPRPAKAVFADADRVRGILERTGFGEIEITARDERVGSGDLDTMLAVYSQVGALGEILRENPEFRNPGAC